jgi:conjugative transfer signal peptidase TraF
MMITMVWSNVLPRQRCFAFAALSIAGGLGMSILVAGWICDLRINTTPSEPLGLWRIVPLTTPVRVGQTVFICPPNNDTMQEGRERGYLRAGLCDGGFGPLIKTVVAVAGQRVDVTDHVAIDGVPAYGSRIVERDGEGRPLRRDRSGIVPPDAIYLHSGFAGSWDSRYFGPIPTSGILGLAQEVLTYAP